MSDAQTNLLALLVSYSFPPVGGAGVQRVAKLVKYLPSHGVTPQVLTVKNPSVPQTDESLFRDIPGDTRIYRTRTFEPGYGLKKAAWSAQRATPAVLSPMMAFRQHVTRSLTYVARQALVPDPQVLWQPTAQLALQRLLSQDRPGRIRAVLISGPPFSQFLLGPLARLHKGVGVVLDYRDEWSTYRTTYEMMGSKLALALGDPLEAAVLRRAHRITTATEEFRENLLRRFSFLSPEQIHTIPNGYDPDDFPAGDMPKPPTDRLVLAYAGTLFKVTSARGLLAAVRLLHERAPALASLLRLRFMGRIVDTETDAFEGSESLGVERLGYLPHKQVLEELSRSHLPLCILDDVPGAERIYPGKVFELMYLGRPMLVLAPPGALAELAHRHHLGHVLHPRDVEAIAALLEDRLRAFREGSLPLHSQAQEVARYHRAAIAGAFAQVLRQAAIQSTS